MPPMPANASISITRRAPTTGSSAPSSNATVTATLQTLPISVIIRFVAPAWPNDGPGT
jgi:hypothetical protein